MNLSSGYESRTQIKKLFLPASPEFDKDGLVSKYVEYEMHRLKQHNVEPSGTLPERLHMLQWYVSFYALMRRDDFIRVPLSAEQIRFLNSPMPLAGVSPAASVGLYNAVAEHLKSHLNLHDPNILSTAVYWWCLSFTTERRLDDRLITADQIALMRTECQWLGEPFALTIFMREYFTDHAELHYLSMPNPRDRAALFNYLLLLSFSQPVISRLLPREHVKRVMRKDKNGISPFQRLVGRHVFDDPEIADGKTLIDEGLRTLAGYGFSLESRWVTPRVRHGDTGDCFATRLPLDGPIEDGVALIGPIFSTSGLGQATRLSLDALTASEKRKPTVIPFTLDNPAPIGFSSDITLEPFANRRAINLIHLNAESIPLAFAYLQSEIFEKSYNIGYFFWELDKLPKCHSLALEMLDEIWVSSEYDREIYARCTDIPVTNVGMAVEDIPCVETLGRSNLNIDENATIFLTTFDSFSFIERKNPIAVVDAFRLAFPRGDENVHLILKTQNRTRVHDPYQRRVWAKIEQALTHDERIIDIDETLRVRDLLALKLACDCYVSLHRSEGWGFGMIEAMLLARPVICTGYSGNMDFCSDETAYLVDFDMIAPTPEEYIFVERGSLWAAPRIESAAAHMRAVAADPASALRKGARAKAFVEANFSVSAIANRYGARLRAIRLAIAAARQRVAE